MKTIAKRTLCMILSVAMIFAFAACGKKEEPAKENTPAGPKEYKIGICNFVDDASLNQIVENIQNTLDSIAKSEGVKFTVLYDNCQTDANVMNQIIQNFIADKVDIMIGIATPIAMGMQAATEDNNIPVVFSAVSDPIVTKIVDSMEKPGKNITGTSDMLNTDSIINMMFAFNPDLKKVGLLYDIGQDSSTTAIANAKKLLAAKGVEVVERTGTNVAEVVLAAEALVAEKVEAIFTPTDNTIMTAELSIYELFAEAGIPHYCGADSFALNGAFLGFGVNYANLGVETAKMAAEILLKGADPATMPVKTFDNGIVTLNEDYMEKYGLKLDDLKKAFADYSSSVQTLKTAESF